MIDARLLPLQRRLLEPPARLLIKLGVNADFVTLIGCILGIFAATSVVFGNFVAALVGLILNRFCDGLDGAIARLTKPTDRGAFLDISLDFLFYAMFPLAFAVYDPGNNALASAVLLASFMLTGTSFLAYSVIAERRGLTSEDYPSKGIFYFSGIAEGAETIAVFVLFCLFPGVFPPLAYVFAFVCLVTAALRYSAGWKLFMD